MDDRHVDLSSSIAEEDSFVAGEGAGAGEVAQIIASCDLQRDLHLVDLFSASGAAARCWKDQGYGEQGRFVLHRDAKAVFKNHCDHTFGGQTWFDVLNQMGGCPAEFVDAWNAVIDQRLEVAF